MSAHPFDRETLLDTVVNIIPLAILAFFTVAFLLFNPWNTGSTTERILQFVLVLVPFVLLAVLTYLTAKRL